MNVGISIAEYNPEIDWVIEHKVKTDTWWSPEIQDIFMKYAGLGLPVYGYGNGDIIAITKAYQLEYAKVREK